MSFLSFRVKLEDPIKGRLGGLEELKKKNLKPKQIQCANPIKIKIKVLLVSS